MPSHLKTAIPSLSLFPTGSGKGAKRTKDLELCIPFAISILRYLSRSAEWRIN